MKKVMIGILVIIPVIIVLVVALVSVFVSTRTHIAVDDITLDKNYVEMEFDTNNSVYKLSDLFTVNVMPDRATNKSYTWTIEDLVCIDEDYKEMWDEGTAPAPAYLNETSTARGGEDETCSQEGYLYVNSYCSFVLKAHAETHVATCIVYVVGYKVESIDVICDGTLTVGESALLQVATTPVDAKVDKMLYESSDPSILTVDLNGVVKAVGEGTATIKAKASVHGSDAYVEATHDITVTKGATVFGNNVTTASNELLFSALGVDAEKVTLVAGATLNGAGDGILLTDSTAIIEVDGVSVNVKKCEEGAIVIDNADLFEAQEDGGFILSTGGQKLYLTASFADMFAVGAPDVTWSSNRETIAKVDENGVVTGVSSGKAVITATAGGKSVSVTINVREVVTVLLVETPAACAEEGIARETVNGSMVYVDIYADVDDLSTYVPNVATFNYTKKDNSFEFNFMRPVFPEGANKEEFYSAYNFKAQEYVGEGDERQLVDSEKAYFVNNKMYFNSSLIEDYTELIVTISAKYPKFAARPEYTTVEFVVKVTKGVSITTWEEALAVSEENNKELEKQTLNPSYEANLLDICLADDVERAGGWIPDDELISELEAINAKVADGKKLKDEEEELWLENGELEGLEYIWAMRDYAKGTEIRLAKDLYGNGHMIYGYKSQYWGTWNSLVKIHTGNTKISNVTLRACEVGDTIINDAEDTQGLAGTCIGIESLNPGDFTIRVPNNLVEFSIIENAGTTFRVYGGDFKLDGCIVRNTSETAIFVHITSNEIAPRYSHVDINNCVFSNMLGTAMSIAFQGYCDGSEEAVERAEQWVAEGKTAVLTQTGFWDIYNWQPTNVLNIIPEIGAINGMIRDALAASETFKEYSRYYENTEYFHLGFIVSGWKSLGQVEQPYLVSSFEDERIQMIDTSEILPEAGNAGAILNGALGGKSIYLFTYGQNGNITPGSTYEVNNRLIRHLHGEI
ncbi:MAG: Ig-like domain-containing protein [Clostridia bacterium]|nr:Ig-like domain-containing protein [Clostridia bacterium]